MASIHQQIQHNKKHVPRLELVPDVLHLQWGLVPAQLRQNPVFLLPNRGDKGRLVPEGPDNQAFFILRAGATGRLVTALQRCLDAPGRISGICFPW